jgi:hypothetical protein
MSPTPRVRGHVLRQQAFLVMRSGQVRIAGVARTSRAYFGPGAVHLPGVEFALSIDCRQEPARAAVTIGLTSPASRPVLSPRRHGLTPFHSSVGGAQRRTRARTPRPVHRIGTRPPGRWGDARRRTAAPAPQAKSQSPRLSPRGAGRAVGGIRVRADRSDRRASSCSTVLLLRAFACADTKTFARGMSRPG